MCRIGSFGDGFASQMEIYWQSSINQTGLIQLKKGKERNADLYSAYHLPTSKRSDVDHTELPANTPHLPLLRISIRGRDCTVSPS